MLLSHVLQYNQTIDSNGKTISSILALSDGQLVTGAIDGTIIIYENYTFKVLHTLKKASNVSSLCLLDNNTFISCSSNDATITIWEYSKKKNKYSPITIGTFNQGKLLISNKYFGLLDY